MIRFLLFLFSSPDSFDRDPYGYISNQAGHIYLGFTITTFYAWILSKIDTYPSQSWVFLAMVGGYLGAWELLRQGWREWDTIEDTLYFSAGASVFLFVDMQWVIDRVFFMTLIMSACLLLGAYVRWGDGR